MILIDNSKFKQLHNILSSNQIDFCEQYTYIAICSTIKITDELNKFLIQNPQVHMQFLKKSQKSISIMALSPYLNNSLFLFGCNEFSLFAKLETYISKAILFIKIQNSIYSINSCKTDFFEVTNVGQTINSFFFNLIQIFYFLSK